MKSLFAVILILLLPLSVYGVEWTVKYPMEQPDGSVIDTKISIPTTPLFNLPYMAGRWGCQVIRTDSKTHLYTQLWVNCVIKGGTADGPVTVKQVVSCNHPTSGELKGLDIKDNYVILILGETIKKTRKLYIWCKL